MSQTQFAFLKKEEIPSKEFLQASINSLGYDLKIDPEFTPFEDEGFSPCQLNGEGDVGFEIYYESVEDVADGDKEIIELAEDRDYCISMCWGGSFKDCACVMVVSLALVKDFGAVVSYEGNGVETQDSLVNGIEECNREIEKGNE